MRYLKLIKEINAGIHFGIIPVGTILSEAMWCNVVGRPYFPGCINLTKSLDSELDNIEYWEETTLTNTNS